MYSLPARVVSVDEVKKTAKLMLRDKNVLDAKIACERMVVVGTYVSVRACDEGYETSGGTFTPAEEW